MKQTATFFGRARGVQLCSVANTEQVGITIGGETYVPDAATAYVEFFLSHAFPAYLDVAEPGAEPYRSTIHPVTVANSYQSLRGKVMNFAHLMRSYDPQKNVRDRIFGTVMAVEFPPPPEGGWKVQGDPAKAPGIRAVAALHKNAEGVMKMLETWQQGETPFGDTEWTVSMENEACREDGGFLLKAEVGDQSSEVGKRLAELEALGQTPKDFRALGWIYVPWAMAPEDLRNCMDAGGIIAVAKNYLETGSDPGVPTLFLNGGLNGRLFYFGVALTPLARESRARVSRVMASADAGLAALASGCDAIAYLCEKIAQEK